MALVGRGAGLFTQAEDLRRRDGGESVEGHGDRDDDEGGGGGSVSIGNKLLVKGMVRKITDDISIRNGKYGDYIFYKTPEMKNPTFLKLKGFTEDYKTCSMFNIIEWIQKTYKI